MRIDFLSIFIHCGLTTQRKKEKYCCPFCKKGDFTFHNDARCHCGQCGFSGNAIEFYAKLCDMPMRQSLGELTKLLETKKIGLKKLSKKEAVEKLSKDLEFLAYVRMYWAFYKESRELQKHYQQDSGLSEAAFNRIINGDISSTSKDRWHLAIAYLHSVMDIEKFTADLAKGALHFEPEADELLYSKTQLKKFQ